MEPPDDGGFYLVIAEFRVLAPQPGLPESDTHIKELTRRTQPCRCVVVAHGASVDRGALQGARYAAGLRRPVVVTRRGGRP